MDKVFLSSDGNYYYVSSCLEHEKMPVWFSLCYMYATSLLAVPQLSDFLQKPLPLHPRPRHLFQTFHVPERPLAEFELALDRFGEDGLENFNEGVEQLSASEDEKEINR